MSAPFSSSSCTITSCMYMTAQCSAVRPLLSLAVMSAPFSSSSRTTNSCPFSAASCSAVSPSFFLRVDFRLVLQQQPRHCLVSFHCHPVQCCPSTRIICVDGHSLLQQPQHSVP